MTTKELHIQMGYTEAMRQAFEMVHETIAHYKKLGITDTATLDTLGLAFSTKFLTFSAEQPEKCKEILETYKTN